MPYIKQEDRVPLDKILKPLISYLQQELPSHVDGDVNYSISKILRNVYPLNYYDQNRAMGVLSCVQQEHYRTVTAPYEELKIQQNGDI